MGGSSLSPPRRVGRNGGAKTQMENYAALSNQNSQESLGRNIGGRSNSVAPFNKILNNVDTSPKKIKDELRDGCENILFIDFRSKQHVNKEIKKQHLIQLLKKKWGLSMTFVQATEAMIVSHRQHM